MTPPVFGAKVRAVASLVTKGRDRCAAIAAVVLALACNDEFTAGASGEPDAAMSGGAAGASGGAGGAGGSGGPGGSSIVEAGALQGGAGGSVGSSDAAAVASVIPATGLLLWVRADAGVVQDAEGRVGAWADQSAARHEATQDAPELRPKLVPSALNGKPALVFDGVDDHLELPPAFNDFSEGVTIFAVVQSDGRGACPGVFETSNGPEIDDLHFGRHDGELIYEVLSSYVRAGEFAAGVPRRISVVHDALGVVELEQSGGAGAIESAALPAVVERRFAFIGRTLYDGCQTWDGAIGEVIIYDRALSLAEFGEVEAYLDARWGI